MWSLKQTFKYQGYKEDMIFKYKFKFYNRSFFANKDLENIKFRNIIWNIEERKE